MRDTRFPPLLVDALMAVGAALAFLGAAFSSPEPGRDVDVVAFVVAALLGGALFFRRRWPLGVFVVSISLITVYMAFDYPAVGLAFPLAASLYTVGSRGQTLPAAIVVAVAIAVGTLARIVSEDEEAFFVVVNMAQEGVGLAAALLLGETVRSRRAVAVEHTERLRLMELDQKSEAERRVMEERVQIARDLHDSIGHNITVISIQANLAAEEFDHDPDQTRTAIESVRDASKEAMIELRSAVTVMRKGRAAPVPARGADGLDDLVDNARSAGLTVTTAIDDLDGLPPLVGMTLYRVVQEALTNVLRHSGADHVELQVDVDQRSLWLRVDDNGTAYGAAPANGIGIAGMTERVTSIGGRLTAGSRPHGGFRVEAAIPLHTGR